MIARRISPGMLALMLVCMTSLTAVANAADNGLLPEIPRGQGDSCVADTDFMRRNHMDMLKHQRDDTMIRGIRSEQYKLTECINCHVVIGADAKPVTISSPQHFCRACHDYAAVSVDCFQCHASRPEQEDLPSDHKMSGTFPTTANVNGTESP